MENSLFKQWVETYFQPVVTKIVEKFNGEQKERTYLHKTMLRKSFSTDLKWASLSVFNSLVGADVVATDSSLPLKKRDSIKQAEGSIPKLGMKMYLNEATLQDLDVLESTNQGDINKTQILSKLFQDAKKCTVGVWETLEYMFLEGLSNGYTSIKDENNTGTEVRIDYGYQDKNKFGVTAKWSDSNATPISDIVNVLDNASKNGVVPMYMLMDRNTWNAFKTKAEAKELFAAHMGIYGSNVPTPTLKQMNEALSDNHGLTIVLIERHVTFEKNGVRTAVKPWADNVIVFLSNMQVGDLAWSRLAEAKKGAKQVDYETVDDYILLSKYATNDPFREYTSSQALVVPVINDVDSIYVMNTEEATASEDTQTEGDEDFSYEGTDYTKASVVAGLNKTGEVATSTTSQTDATLAKKIDKLSEEGVAIFEAELVASA